MVTFCLIGSDPSVTVRPFWNHGLDAAPTTFRAALNKWGNLSELQLNAGESAFKIARRAHDGVFYTWIALYRAAGAFKADRPHTNMGLGMLLTDAETVPGDIALDLLAGTLKTFLDGFAPDGKLICALQDITPALFPEPDAVARLRAAVYQRSEGTGLAVQTTSTAGGVVFFDLAGPEEAAQIASYLNRCQSDPRFTFYHTLLIGDAPEPSEKRLVKGVEVTGVDRFFSLPEHGGSEAELSVPAEQGGSYSDRQHGLHPTSSSSSPAAQRGPMQEYVPVSPHLYVGHDGDSNYWRALAHVLLGVIAIGLILALLGYRLTKVHEMEGAANQSWTMTPPADRAGASDASPAPATGDGAAMDPGNGEIQASIARPIGTPMAAVNRYFDQVSRGRAEQALAAWHPETRPPTDPEHLALALERFRGLRITVEESGDPTVIGPALQAEVAATIRGALDGVPFVQRGIVVVRAYIAEKEPHWLIVDEGSLSRYDPLRMTP